LQATISNNEAANVHSRIVSFPNQIEKITTELKRNNIEVPDCIAFCSNLFSEYEQWKIINDQRYSRNPRTLDEIYKELDISHEGEEITENLNTLVKVTTKLLEAGHIFQGKDKNTVKDFVGVGFSGIEKKRVVKSTSPVPFVELKNRDSGCGEVPGLFERKTERTSSHNLGSSLSNSDGGSFVIRLRGLPWKITEEDIIEFFSGLTIVPGGLYLIRDSAGRPMGEGYVRFDSQYERDEAVKRHKNYIGRRYIEVFSSSMEEWYSAGGPNLSSNSTHDTSASNLKYSSGDPRFKKNTNENSHSPPGTRSMEPLPPDDGNYVIRMRGLPYSVTIEDIQEFFGGIGIRKDQIFILIARGEGTGGGFIKLNSQQQVERAMKFHNSRIGHRYIELFKSDPAELSSALSRYEYLRPQRDYMRGSRDRDIERHRYSPYDRNQSLRHSAPAYSGPTSNHDYWRPPSSSGPPYPTRGNCALRLRGLPYSVTLIDIERFFEDAKICRDGIHFLRNHQGKLSGEAYVEFCSPEDKRIALRKQKNRIGSRYIELFHVSEEDYARFCGRGGRENAYSHQERYGSVDFDPAMMPVSANVPPRNIYESSPNVSDYPPPYNSYGGRSGNYNYVPAGRPPPPPYISDSMYAPPPAEEASLVIRGLTAHVTMADIQRYFSGYNFISDSIRVVSNLERTIFEASVLFSSAHEARRALQEKEYGKIGETYIRLYDH